MYGGEFMRQYIDSGNDSFSSDVHSEIYVDKTGLLRELNRSINTTRRWFAVSRPRRFGKSMAAAMIRAYYSCDCDSAELFAPFDIAKTEDYQKHLNKYHVLHFDVTEFLDPLNGGGNILSRMDQKLIDDMREVFPDIIDERKCDSAPDAVMRIYQSTKRKFVIIIDEWDCLIRDRKDEKDLIMSYLSYLRGFFKTESSKEFLALGYITGILPIKKFEGESAMNNFVEYTMLDPRRLAPFFGFTEEEVGRLCDDKAMDAADIRDWYDGYLMSYNDQEGHEQTIHVFNPNSLISALMEHSIKNYWKNTGAFRQLNDYIARNEEGLKDTVLRLLTGERCPVRVDTFQNDLTSYQSKDDVLTAMIHMGYLGYDVSSGEAFIPNEEVRAVFDSAIRVGEWRDVRDALDHSDELLQATWDMDGDHVARVIADSHQDYASILTYHDENSLACAIMMSYYTARKHYLIFRELPTGKGFADIVFIPKPHSDKPAMIVELKWDHTVKTAIDQIRDRNYAGKLKDFRDVLMVGISYERERKEYKCIVERTDE